MRRSAAWIPQLALLKRPRPALREARAPHRLVGTLVGERPSILLTPSYRNACPLAFEFALLRSEVGSEIDVAGLERAYQRRLDRLRPQKIVLDSLWAKTAKPTDQAR
jgi:hypothetical protein